MEMPAGVCIFSLLANADKDTFYDIFVLHDAEDDFTDSCILRLCGQFPNCRISFRAVSDVFRDAFEIRGITRATYYKLLIPEVIPEYDKVLYSDVDVIFREDQSHYLDIDMDGCFFASVNSVPVMNKDYLSYIQSIGLSPSEGYFYAGNLVVNAKLLRERNMVPVFLKHLDKHYRFQDMDIINLSCSGRIKSLPPAFCLSGTYYEAIVSKREKLLSEYTGEELDYAVKKGIVHYNGPKPWKESCLNMDIWWEYYRNSVFFDEKFAFDFWFGQTFLLERMTLMKRIKLVGRYFREGGRK
jgi:lipopolysaccharide biosynthesis glycosyltransferase